MVPMHIHLHLKRHLLRAADEMTFSHRIPSYPWSLLTPLWSPPCRDAAPRLYRRTCYLPRSHHCGHVPVPFPVRMPMGIVYPARKGNISLREVILTIPLFLFLLLLQLLRNPLLPLTPQVEKETRSPSYPLGNLTRHSMRWGCMLSQPLHQQQYQREHEREHERLLACSLTQESSDTRVSP
jgi:hypothetical protein